jgi:protein-S-isoprenylcysteine O-methyltransferase Ste14
VGVIFALIAIVAVAGFAMMFSRARREWTTGETLSRTSAASITALWLLVAGLLLTALAWRPWAVDVRFGPAAVVGGAAVLGGLALALPGYLPFRSVRHLYGLRRGGLITEGVFRFSRNPQYTGVGLVAAGAAVIGRSGLGLLVVGAYWVGIRTWVQLEEAHLERSFGAAYADYRASTPRFLGRTAGG